MIGVCGLGQNTNSKILESLDGFQKVGEIPVIFPKSWRDSRYFSKKLESVLEVQANLFFQKVGEIYRIIPRFWNLGWHETVLVGALTSKLTCFWYDK